MELIVEAHQNDRNLFPGCSLIRSEYRTTGAVHQAHVVGHGDITGAAGDILKGRGQLLHQSGNGAVTQGPHQHHRQFLPGYGIVGPEVFSLVCNSTVVIGSLYSAGVPCIHRHILKRGLIGNRGLPPEKAAQHHSKGRAGHLLTHAKLAGTLSLEESQTHTSLDALRRPVTGRDIPKACRGSGNHRRGG